MRSARAPWRIVLACTTAVVTTVLVAGTPDAVTRAETRDPEIVLSHAARAWRREARHLTSAPAPTVAAVGQILDVTLEPGPLTILRAPDAVVLRRATPSGPLQGTARVLVADARGTEEGFVLRASVTVADSGTAHLGLLTLGVRKVVATADSTRGVRAVAHRLAGGAPVVLLRVAPRVGNSAFEVSLGIEAKSPRPGVDRITVLPRFVVD